MRKSKKFRPMFLGFLGVSKVWIKCRNEKIWCVCVCVCLCLTVCLSVCLDVWDSIILRCGRSFWRKMTLRTALNIFLCLTRVTFMTYVTKTSLLMEFIEIFTASYLENQTNIVKNQWSCCHDNFTIFYKNEWPATFLNWVTKTLVFLKKIWSIKIRSQNEPKS